MLAFYIAIIIFFILILTLAFYLLSHLNKPFLTFKPTTMPSTLKVTMKICAYLLIAVCVLGIILLIFASPHFQLITLLLASFITAFLAVQIGQLS